MTLPTSRNYRDLQVWQQAIEIVEAVYHASDRWPAGERHALTDQVRRAAVSIASNIAEGWGRQRDGEGQSEFRHFLRIAYGSLMEVETQLTIAARLRYGERQDLDALRAGTTTLAKMLNALMSAVAERRK